MDKIAGILLITLLAIVFAVSFSYYIVSQTNENGNTPSPTPTQTPEPTLAPEPTPTSSAVVANLNINQGSSTEESYLIILGNVTNTTPNTLYNVGLHVYSFGYPYMGQPAEVTLIDTTVPIASGTYGNGQYTLSTLAPYESLQVTIKIIPSLAYRTPRLYGNEVNPVWTNSP